MHPRQLSTIKFCYRIKEELHHSHRGDAIERVALLMMHKKWILKKKGRLNCCCLGIKHKRQPLLSQSKRINCYHLGHVAQIATFDVAVWVMPK
jgi:hypothetical protein